MRHHLIISNCAEKYKRKNYIFNAKNGETPLKSVSPYCIYSVRVIRMVWFYCETAVLSSTEIDLPVSIVGISPGT